MHTHAAARLDSPRVELRVAHAGEHEERTDELRIDGVPQRHLQVAGLGSRRAQRTEERPRRRFLLRRHRREMRVSVGAEDNVAEEPVPALGEPFVVLAEQLAEYGDAHAGESVVSLVLHAPPNGVASLPWQMLAQHSFAFRVTQPHKPLPEGVPATLARVQQSRLGCRPFCCAHEALFQMVLLLLLVPRGPATHG